MGLNEWAFLLRGIEAGKGLIDVDASAGKGDEESDDEGAGSDAAEGGNKSGKDEKDKPKGNSFILCM